MVEAILGVFASEEQEALVPDRLQGLHLLPGGLLWTSRVVGALFGKARTATIYLESGTTPFIRAPHLSSSMVSMLRSMLLLAPRKAQ